jgi:hypothetical protein
VSLHQVTLRKDGPTHALVFEKGRYAYRTLCGLSLSGLERPQRRIFDPSISESCGRCVISYRKKARAA